MHIPNYKGNGLKFEVHPNHRSASRGCLAASSYSKSYLKLLRSLSSTRFHPFPCENYSSTSLSIICSHGRHHLPQPGHFVFVSMDLDWWMMNPHTQHPCLRLQGWYDLANLQLSSCWLKINIKGPLECRVQVVQYMQNYHSSRAQTELPSLKRSKKIAKEHDW